MITYITVRIFIIQYAVRPLQVLKKSVNKVIYLERHSTVYGSYLYQRYSDLRQTKVHLEQDPSYRVFHSLRLCDNDIFGCDRTVLHKSRSPLPTAGLSSDVN